MNLKGLGRLSHVETCLRSYFLRKAEMIPLELKEFYESIFNGIFGSVFGLFVGTRKEKLH